VRLRAFGQKDPLLEYKEEGFELFENLIQAIEENVTQMLFRLTDPARRHRIQPGKTRREMAAEQARERLRSYSYSAADKESDRSFAAREADNLALGGRKGPGRAGGDAPTRQPVRVEIKIKPNDPCPCGSGKKYKKCCGRLNA
jgi:preprotein translocase subunit SecA